MVLAQSLIVAPTATFVGRRMDTVIGTPCKAFYLRANKELSYHSTSTYENTYKDEKKFLPSWSDSNSVKLVDK